MQDFVLNVEPLPFSITKFKIHVNKDESFLSNFEPLRTSTKHSSTLMKPKDVNPFNWYLAWVTLYSSACGELPLPKFRVGDTVRVSRYKSTFGKGYEANFTEEIFKGTAKDITKVAMNKDNPYFASLLAACIISHVGGISRKHLVETEGTPKLVTSMARYFVYYSMKRFTEDPRKMASYITSEMKELVKANLQTKTLWKRKFVRTREEAGAVGQKDQKLPLRVFEKQHRRARDRVRRGQPRHQQEQRLDDLRKKGQRRFDEDGTKTFPTGGGILRLRHAGRAGTNSLAHCRTRGKVSANQEIFHRLVKDTVIQDNLAKAVADMRLAIKTRMWS